MSAAYIDQVTAGALPCESLSDTPLHLVSVSGSNHSGGAAYLQVYDNTAGSAPTVEAPIYSYPAPDGGTASIVVAGQDPRNPGRPLEACVVCWSSSPDSYAPVDGTWNAYGVVTN